MTQDQGWIAINRNILNNTLWLSESFSRSQAWIDLLLIANHKDNFFFIRDIKIDVKRGELARGEVSLAERWRWSRNKVRNFLKLLEKEQQIIIKKSKVINKIVIINYEKYQENNNRKNNRKTTESTTEGQQKGQQKNINNNVNNKNNDNNVNNIDDYFNEFWQAFPINKRTKGSKKDARLKFNTALKKDNYSQIMEGLKNYERFIASTGQSNQDAHRWLEKERWADEYTVQQYEQPQHKSKHQRAREALGID